MEFKRCDVNRSCACRLTREQTVLKQADRCVNAVFRWKEASRQPLSPCTGPIIGRVTDTTASFLIEVGSNPYQFNGRHAVSFFLLWLATLIRWAAFRWQMKLTSTSTSFRPGSKQPLVNDMCVADLTRRLQVYGYMDQHTHELTLMGTQKEPKPLGFQEPFCSPLKKEVFMKTFRSVYSLFKGSRRAPW